MTDRPTSWQADSEEPAPLPDRSSGPAPAPPPSRRWRTLLVGVVLAAAVAVVAVLAITGDDGDDAAERQLVADLQKDWPDLAPDDAECFAEDLVDRLGADKVTPEALQDPANALARLDAYGKAADACGLLDQIGPMATVVGGGDVEPVPGVGELPGLTGTGPDMTPEERLAYYEQRLRLSHDQAVCLRDAWLATPGQLGPILDACPQVTISDLLRSQTDG